jgi:hypothetical protein
MTLTSNSTTLQYFVSGKIIKSNKSCRVAVNALIKQANTQIDDVFVIPLRGNTISNHICMKIYSVGFV